MNQADEKPESDPHSDSESARSEEEAPLTFWQVLSSTLAAAVGVQSSANRKRDFTRGTPKQFILMGIGFTVVFVLLMVGVVQLVLSLV